VWYDYSTNQLHFKDGSYWVMGCTSAGTEQDAGTMYPTLMEDTNGNYITVSYLAGGGPFDPSSQGWNAPNTSARINQIIDARAGHLLTGTVSYQRGYDIEGNVVITVDPLGHTTNTTVDSFGNVPSTVAPNNNGNLSTSFQFNSFLGLTNVSNTNGTSASITYDANGRPVYSTD